MAGETAADASHFKIVADYIHLNPARAGLAGGRRGKLSAYEWSSLPCYRKGKGPAWQAFDRVMRACGLACDPRGRRAYVDYLEARAVENKGRLSDPAMAALLRGWYLGDASFKDRLLSLVSETSKRLHGKGNHSGGALAEHGEREAERLVCEGLAVMGMDGVPLKDQRKGDAGKVALATLVRTRTAISNAWVSKRLHMGHDRSVSRLIRQGAEDAAVTKWLKQLEGMLPCADWPYTVAPRRSRHTVTG